MNKLDGTLDDVQNTRFCNIYHDLVKQMSKTTQFNEVELTCILMVYHKFLLANGTKAKAMTKKQFLNLFLVLFQIYDLQIIERILLSITTEGQKNIDPVAWVKLFSVFMSDNLEEKMNFAFRIYCPVGGVNYLNREIVTINVEKFFTGDDEDEVNELRSDMVDTLFKKFDVDKDGLISFEDYAIVVAKQPLLCEFLGQCFPETNGLTVIAYCTNLMSKIVIDSGDIEEEEP